MDQQRNLIIAVALSVAILFGFNFFFQQPRPTPAPSPGTTVSQQVAEGQAPSAPATTAPAVPATALIADVVKRTPRVDIETPHLKGTINLQGGVIDDLVLTTYREEIDDKSPQIVLLAPEGTEHPYYAEAGWVGDPKANVKLPGENTLWTSGGGTLTPEHPIDLTWDNGEGLKFTRRYAVDKDYLFTVTDSVRNDGAGAVQLYPFALIRRAGAVPASSTWVLHEGPVGVLDGTLRETKYSSLKVEKPEEFSSTGGWLGITDKYWLTALVPDQKEPLKARFTHTLRDKTDVYQVDFTGSSAHELGPGQSLSSSERLFAGAKEVALLDRYEADAGIPRFDRAIDFGWFYFLTKPIFLTLDFFNQWLGNFGVSILLLTLLIKLAFFPLANKSYRAMSKMKALQPEMQKLRERFGEDKQRLNQEMMALYKRVGANPMAGCLPIIIQIPVFFSLYKVLYVTIEMRHAAFFGWIHDLSAPDHTSILNLFGLLPFDPPGAIAFLSIGAWPLLMGCTMFLQQKLNPQPPDPVQAKMFMILPVVFTFMLSSFPSGLVIYWSWNNLLSIGQQWLIMRRAQPAAAKAVAAK